MTNSHNTSFLGTFSMPADANDVETMIKVDQVSMVFNIASEQLNSLKEYAIALSKKELRFKEFRALDNVSFEVKRGDVFGILGTNGSGKSTILKIISGVLDPTNGSCFVRGSIAPLIELGAGFDLELTARENIFLNGALLGYSKKFIQQHFDEIVDFAEVRNFLDMPMKNYSSGMVARIAFAIATVIIPDVLIVDEVLSVGDFMFQQKCEQRIQDLIKEHNVTVLIVSHNNAQIERLCNKAAWIEKGHLRAIGSATEVCRIYRAIGGRSGSSKSESIVLDALRDSPFSSSPISASISGENRYGTAAKMAAYCNAESDTVLLTNSDSGRENYLACSLAGIMNGIMLTTQSDHLPDATAQELLHIKPKRIIAIGDEEKISRNLLDTYTASHNETEIQRIACHSRPYGIDVLDFPKLHPEFSWGNTIAIALEPCDGALVSLSPYIFNNAVPILFVDEREPNHGLTKQMVGQFSRCLLLADEEQLPDSAITILNESIEIIRFHGREDTAVNSKINEWVLTESNDSGSFPIADIIITSPHSTIDNYCLGPLAGRMHAEILFADPLDLDSVAATINALKNNEKAKRLTFIGNELRFNRIDKAIFEKALSDDVS